MVGDELNGPPPRPTRSSEVAAALRELNNCVDRIQALLPRVHAVIDRRVEPPTRRRPMTRIIFAGGPSVFGRRESRLPQRTPSHRPPTPNPPFERLVGAPVAEPPTPETSPRHRPPVSLSPPPSTGPVTRNSGPHGRRFSRQLVVAADLALAGYSKEQITARLEALGDRGAIDEAFE